MAARALWKGNLLVGRHHVPLKMYSSLEERGIHFRLLHAKDRAPVVQRIVRKDTGEEVAKEDRRKALPLEAGTAVILQPEDLQQLEPPPSRDIEICRFVPRSVLSDQWYDRPYYLGPDGDNVDYFALAEALGKKRVIGIARWVMRKKRYLGALELVDGYLMMVTLRRADQVLSFSGIELEKSTAPADSELKLAQQLVATISGDFEPETWEDQYRKRVLKLVEAKARGEKITPIKAKKRKAPVSLAASLKASLAASRERKVA